MVLGYRAGFCPGWGINGIELSGRVLSSKSINGIGLPSRVFFMVGVHGVGLPCRVLSRIGGYP